MSEPISIDKLSESLRDRRDQLRRILTKDVQAVKTTILPWQEEMREYVRQAPYRDFGTYLRKVLKTPINTKQMIAGEGGYNATPLVVGRNFYYKKYGKKKVFPSDKMFFAFKREFADLITTGHKRELVLDFLRFKLAMCKYLEPFTKPQSFEVSIPLEMASVGCVGISDGLLPETGKPKIYNYFAGMETVKPTFMTIFFTEFPQFHNQTIEKLTNNFDERTQRDWSVVVSLFNCDYNGGAYNLLGSTVISLDELTMDEDRKRNRLSSLNTAELQMDILKGGNRIRSVKVELDWDSKERTSLAIANDNVMTGGSVVGIANNPLRFKQLIPNPQYSRVNQTRQIVTNWSEVLALPKVQETIGSYVSTWNLITRSWNFMKQKYAYKVLLHGHF